jgi:hypothetical protein
VVEGQGHCRNYGQLEWMVFDFVVLGGSGSVCDVFGFWFSLAFNWLFSLLLFIVTQ